MKLKLQRFSSGPDDTLGLLFIDGVFACFVLEDEGREVKISGETRIPGGTYKIELRTVGGFDARYDQKYSEIHKGMLWLKDVPGFEYVLIHVGNTDADTAGCLLVGDSATQNVSRKGFVGSSGNAYRRIYPVIASAVMTDAGVTIEVTDR